MSRGYLDDEPRRSDLIDLAGEIHAETAKAVLFYDGARKAWLP